MAQAKSIGVQVQAVGMRLPVEPVADHRMTRGCQMEPDLVSPAGNRARQHQATPRLPHEDPEQGLGRFTLTRRAGSVTALTPRDIQQAHPVIMDGTAADPGQIFLAHRCGLKGSTEFAVDRPIQGKEHHPTGIQIQSMMQRDIDRGRAPGAAQVALQSGIQVVVGIAGDLLAGNTGFFVVSEKMSVAP